MIILSTSCDVNNLTIPTHDSEYDKNNPDIFPSIDSIDHHSYFINTDRSNILFVHETSCQLLKFSLSEDSGSAPTGSWTDFDSTITIDSSNYSDGQKLFLNILGKALNGNETPVTSFEIYVDKSVEIDTFYWHSTRENNLEIGDNLSLELFLKEDSIGHENLGHGSVYIEGWDRIQLEHVQEGHYRTELTITAETPFSRNEPLTAKFIDRAGNTASPHVAVEQLTSICSAGKDSVFYIGQESTPIEMVWIPRGTFWMGAQSDETFLNSDVDETPRHQVILTKGFWIGKYEVTQEQYSAVIEDTEYSFDENPLYPAENISWDDINDHFLPQLNNGNDGFLWRLPTEAEWEYSCRAGYDENWFWWGSNLDSLDEFAVSMANSNAGGGYTIHPIGSLSPNPFGLHDMLGNVQEWCSDYYNVFTSYYSICPSPDIDPTGIDPHPDYFNRRMARGGSFRSVNEICRPAYRTGRLTSIKLNWVGFRLVREANRTAFDLQ